MTPSRVSAATLGLLLALPLLLAWPLPLVWRTEVLASPALEAATHIWGLWAALRSGAPLHLQTTLLAWPRGVSLVLSQATTRPTTQAFWCLARPVPCSR